MWEDPDAIECVGYSQNLGGYVFYAYGHERMNAFETWLDENVGRQVEDWTVFSFLEGAYRRYVVPSEEAATLAKLFWC
jgi:hypothetical protein